MTYFIHPKHMSVNYPRNATNKDLIHENEDFRRPLNEPTSMSYFLQRIRFAEICRSIVDHLSPWVYDIENNNYDDVVFLDEKIETFLKELPIFLCLDEKSRKASEEIDQTLPQISIQRYIMNVSVHCRRIKLN